MNIAYNCDCMDLMRSLPDNAFDLAVVDPPYGDGLHAEDGGCKGWFTKYNMNANAEAFEQATAERERERKPYNRFGQRFDRYKQPTTCTAADASKRERERDGNADGRHLGGEVRKKIIAWDVAPKEEFFTELFRVSRNQVIWGGNYFLLPPTRCFLVWRKLTISEGFSMAMAEYAWTSFNANAKVFDFAPQGKKSDPRFHPTAKPIALYAWIYNLFAKQGDKILDTHLGSGSSRIAAYDAGLDFVGCEIEPYYFQKQEERYEAHTAQRSLFNME